MKSVKLSAKSFKLFDSHFHIINKRYPLVPNQGYIPEEFTCSDYLTRMKEYNLCGGAVVSGSFQAFDQSYLIDALSKLGPSFVGVTQLPHSATDEEILSLNDLGIRGVRFNMRRGGSEKLSHLDTMAKRIYELAGWHVELYIDSKYLKELFNTLTKLPAVSIDHLGLSKAGFNTLLALAEKGIHIKASGFGRIDFKVTTALRELYSANPEALMFGTDLPSTRAPRPYEDTDFFLVIEALGEKNARRVFYENAIEFYKPKATL